MKKAETSSKPPRGELQFLILSNGAMMLLAAGILFAAFARYHTSIDATTLTDSRYFTTEWRLLREMKEQTDRQLLDKDREIAVLNELYLRLVQENASSWELLQAQTKLRQAETERQEIAAAQITESRGEAAAEDPLFQELFTPAGETERAASLEARLSSARETAERGLRELEGQPLLSMEDLNAKALTRALLGSPQIRSEYPDLLASLDHFLAEYGRLERTQGKREAYSKSLETLLLRE